MSGNNGSDSDDKSDQHGFGGKDPSDDTHERENKRESGNENGSEHAHEREREHEHELEFEQPISRAEIATHLETFATNLRNGGAFEVTIAEQTTLIDPPETVEFEVELEDEPEEGGVERSLEFELEWGRQDHETPLGE